MAMVWRRSFLVMSTRPEPRLVLKRFLAAGSGGGDRALVRGLGV
jgi:hypothetical protein